MEASVDQQIGINPPLERINRLLVTQENLQRSKGILSTLQEYSSQLRTTENPKEKEKVIHQITDTLSAKMWQFHLEGSGTAGQFIQTCVGLGILKTSEVNLEDRANPLIPPIKNIIATLGRFNITDSEIMPESAEEEETLNYNLIFRNLVSKLIQLSRKPSESLSDSEKTILSILQTGLEDFFRLYIKLNLNLQKLEDKKTIREIAQRLRRVREELTGVNHAVRLLERQAEQQGLKYDIVNNRYHRK